MDRFGKYVGELFAWNEQMKEFLQSEKVGNESELWKQLDDFTVLIESTDRELSDDELLQLQASAENIHKQMEGYFRGKQEKGEIWLIERPIPAGGHKLPNLQYPYSALEPYISEEIMWLHHTKHHQSYVDGLNKAEIHLKTARETNDYSLIKHWSRELAFHGSGHYLHSILWTNLSPHGGGKPSGLLLEEIERYFGSFEVFKIHFSEAAKHVEGSGWALLVYSPKARHLEILQTEKHMELMQIGTIPILVLDVWEHAYYLQYRNNRAEYVENFWKVINWHDVETRLEKAADVEWQGI